MVKRYFFIAFLLGISSNISASIDWSSPSTCNIEDSKNLDEIIGQMTLRQKIGQIIMQLGSVLNGGGSWPNNKKTSTVKDWQNLSKAYYDASPVIGDQIVPIIWGTDAVHGHSNVIGATVFPHNIGIGATQDTDLIKRIAEVVAKEVLSILGLEGSTEKNILELSGGEQQRVQIARVLAQIWDSSNTNPKLLLLDEPTSNLDIVYQHILLDLLLKRVSKNNLSVIIVLHDINLAARYATHIGLIKDGQLIKIGETEQTLIPELIKTTFGVSSVIQKHPILDCLQVSTF